MLTVRSSNRATRRLLAIILTDRNGSRLHYWRRRCLVKYLRLRIEICKRRSQPRLFGLFLFRGSNNVATYRTLFTREVDTL
jgi:hypothetical protein